MKNKILLASSVSLLSLGFARPVMINPEEVLKSNRWSIQEPEEQKKNLRSAKDPLARAGISEALKDWPGCVQNLRHVSNKSPVHEWALLLELECATQMNDPESKNKIKGSTEILAESLKRIENAPVLDHSKILIEKKKAAILAGRLMLCRNLKKMARWKELRAELQKAFTIETDYNRVDRAELFELAGEVMVAERQWSEAFAQFQRSRELNPEMALTDTRIRAILPMVPPAVKESFENRFKNTPALQVAPVSPATDELEYVDQAESFLTRNDPSSAVEAMTKLIRKFPAGIRAKWATDKIFELLNIEIEKSKGPNGPSVIKKKILSAMGDLDSDRQYDWGKSLFDMQMYADAAPLLKRSADQIAGSAKASKAYYLSGRAFQLSSDYSHAKDMYQTILKKFPAAPETVDAAIQWALVNINENDASEAITHLEVARSRRLTSQQDLISLFWLYQSYRMKNTEAGISATATDLTNRFGLTYYGLIAYQDTKKVLPQFPKVKSKPTKVYFSTQESEALNRAKLLIESGLFNEALDELAVFSNRALSQDEQEYLLNFYAQSVHHQKAFGIITSLFDDSPEKKSESMVKKLFPKEFYDLVSNDKLRSDLDPFLILSVMKQESAFDHNAVSRSGALGLLQMIPPTAQEVKSELKSDLEMPSGLTDPATNVRYCAYYLAKLIKKFNGSIPLALAAYNAGPTRISQFINAKGGAVRDTWVDELPWAETSFYVKSILKNYLMYRILYGGLNQLPSPPWSTPNLAPTPGPTP